MAFRVDREKGTLDALTFQQDGGVPIYQQVYPGIGICLICYNKLMDYKNMQGGYKVEPMNLKIGEKLKSIRMARALSLGDTAAADRCEQAHVIPDRTRPVCSNSDNPLEDRHEAENTTVRFLGGAADGIHRYWPKGGKRDFGGRWENKSVPNVHR